MSITACPCSAYEPHVGPITQHHSAKSYFDKHHLDQVFECLMAGLMIERPVDYVTYLNKTIEKIQKSGNDPIKDPIAFDRYIRQLHPLNDPQRRQLIKEPRPRTPLRDEDNDYEKDFQLPFDDINYFLQKHLDGPEPPKVVKKERDPYPLPFGHIDYFTQEMDEQERAPRFGIDYFNESRVDATVELNPEITNIGRYPFGDVDFFTESVIQFVDEEDAEPQLGVDYLEQSREDVELERELQMKTGVVRYRFEDIDYFTQDPK